MSQYPPTSMNLNVHLSVPSTSVSDGSHTPNTPEILNSIVNMQSDIIGASVATEGPFAGFSASSHVEGDGGFDSKAEVQSTLENMLSPGDSCSSCSFAASSPSQASLASTDSTASTPVNPAISVQQYTSQFIKEGLKMKVKQKLGKSRAESITTTPVAPPPPPAPCSPPCPLEVKNIKVEEELTEEDSVRRMRRRERNKVAATKCRNKKKHRTMLLIKENDNLESQNVHLKSEISKLEKEKRHLTELLSLHEPTCAKKRKRNHKHNEVKAKKPLPTCQNPTSTGLSLSMPPPMSTPSMTTSITSSPVIMTPSAYSSVADPFSVSTPGLSDAAFNSIMGLEQQETADHNPRLNLMMLQCGFDQPDNAGADDREDDVSFLVKRPLGYSHLDLDSRCLAL